MPFMRPNIKPSEQEDVSELLIAEMPNGRGSVAKCQVFVRRYDKAIPEQCIVEERRRPTMTLMRGQGLYFVIGFLSAYLAIAGMVACGVCLMFAYLKIEPSEKNILLSFLGPPLPISLIIGLVSAFLSYQIRHFANSQWKWLWLSFVVALFASYASMYSFCLLDVVAGMEPSTSLLRLSEFNHEYCWQVAVGTWIFVLALVGLCKFVSAGWARLRSRARVLPGT